MPLDLSLNNLGSRVARQAIGNNSVRRFATNAIEQKQDENGGIIGTIWNGFSRFTGSLVSKVLQAVTSVAKFSFTLLWSLVVSTVQFVWNFNWNATDKELDESINSAFTALAGSVGGTLGNALGYLVCGALPGALLLTFNEPLALHVLEQVGEEALDEIAGNVANLIKQVGNLTIRSTLTFVYKNVRRLWRQPDSKFKQSLIAQGITSDEAISKAMAERNKPWSFAQAFEDTIDAIPNEALKNFTEEFFEEFTDSCVEAGYVVANSIDSYLAAQQLAADNTLGPVRTVEVLLNRDSSTSTTTPGTTS